MDVDTQFERLISFRMEIGESPVWDNDLQRLWFVDILAPAIYALEPATKELSTYAMPSPVGSVGLATEGRLIVAMRTGVHLFDPESGRLEFLVNPEPDVPLNRLNDGKVGPDGNFWVGSMHDERPAKPTGALYRITPDGRCDRMVSGIHVSNGLAWSPDGKTMYHADSRGYCVKAFDFDPQSGEIDKERLVAELSFEDGLPDGAAVDVDGIYWSAGITAGVVHRIDPETGIRRSTRLPVAMPTMPCFGGADMRTLFITSLTGTRDGVSGEGTLIACRMERPGVAVGRFGVPRAHT